MNEVAITCAGIREPAWLNRVELFCNRIMEEMGIDGWEVSLLFCSNTIIRELNKRYRGQDEPTDILSFAQRDCPDDVSPSDHPIFTAGDIVISIESLKQNAWEYKQMEAVELKRLLIHGLLHLKGMDHSGQDNAMIDLQEKILMKFKEEKIF